MCLGFDVLFADGLQKSDFSGCVPHCEAKYTENIHFFQFCLEFSKSNQGLRFQSEHCQLI